MGLKPAHLQYLAMNHLLLGLLTLNIHVHSEVDCRGDSSCAARSNALLAVKSSTRTVDFDEDEADQDGPRQAKCYRGFELVEEHVPSDDEHDLPKHAYSGTACNAIGRWCLHDFKGECRWYTCGKKPGFGARTGWNRNPEMSEGKEFEYITCEKKSSR